MNHPATVGNARRPRSLRTVMAVSGQRSTPPTALDELVGDLIARIPPPLSLVPGPWPVPNGQPGVGDDALRALLTDDWVGAKMSAAKLRKLIDTQLVSRHRELAADHPDACDLGINVDGAGIGRLLLDLDRDLPGDRIPVVLVDIALRPDRQRQGVGGRLVRELLATAGEHHLPVHATGVYGSASLAWLQRLGLVDVGGDALFRQLVWPAP
jgi:GNAT superfamily N-acetyltransferase